MSAEIEQGGDLQSNAPGYMRQLAEVLVFLFLIVPSMLLSLLAFQHEKATFAYVAWAVILRDAALVCLILYFVWTSGEGRRSIGLTFRNGLSEIALGAVLFVPFFFFAAFVDRMVRAGGLSSPPSRPTFLTPHGTPQEVLAFFLVVVVAISEETMFRGYLIRRLGFLTRSTAVGLILSTLIFTIGHGYEGSAGMFTVGVMGFIFGLVYLWRKNLVAPITMHFLQDFIGIVLVPLLLSR